MGQTRALAADKKDMGRPDGARHRCSGVYTALLLAHVRRAAGREGVQLLLGRVGDHDLDQTSSAAGWIAIDRLREFAAAAEGILGDRSAVGRGIATETLRWDRSMGDDEVLRALGDPREILRRAAIHSDRMSTAYSVALVDSSAHHGAIEIRYEPDVAPLALVCDGHLELYPRLVELLGGAAAATHPRCALRGDEVCRFEIRWDAGMEVYEHHDHVGLLERLHSAARAMALAPDDDSLYDLALAGAQDLTFTGVDGLILIVDWGDGKFPRIRTEGFADASSAAQAIELLEGPAPAAGGGTFLAAPLEATRNTYGRLVACFPPGARTTPHDARVFNAYASHVATAIEARHLRGLLQHQALHDDLTGLANRAHLRSLAEDSLRTSAGSSSTTGVLYIDLDNFKDVNDTFGHNIGDEVLQNVADRLTSAARAGDVVGRIGGDEFVILARQLRGPAELRRLTDAVQRSLRLRLVIDDKVVTVSATVGVATSSRETCDWDGLLRAADEAMYAGKARGRDTVVHG